MSEPIIRTETLKYTFAPEELVGVAKRLAQHQNELGTLEEELNQIKADYKAKTSAAEAERNRCSLRITSGYEMRSVRQLVLKFRPDQKSKLIVRLDTGRARVERMEQVETQLTLSTDANPYIFEADFVEDMEGPLSVMLCEHVPLTKDEAELVREFSELRPLRLQIESNDPDRVPPDYLSSIEACASANEGRGIIKALELDLCNLLKEGGVEPLCGENVNGSGSVGFSVVTPKQWGVAHRAIVAKGYPKLAAHVKETVRQGHAMLQEPWRRLLKAEQGGGEAGVE